MSEVSWEMPLITLDMEDLRLLIGRNISSDEIVSTLSSIGSEIQSYSEKTIEVEFFPNRPDLYSVEGVARALRAYYEIKKGMPVYNVNEGDISMTVDDSVMSVRPYIVCGVIRNVKLTHEGVASLMDLQEKLHLTLGRKRMKCAIGVHDLDAVKPPFEYTGVEPDEISFEPLGHSVEMNLREIVKRHEKGIEYGHILEDYDKYPIILDKNKNVLSFPPIINGTLTAVTEYTENLFIEMTGTHLKTLSHALSVLMTSLAERCGEIENVRVIHPEYNQKFPDLSVREMSVKKEYIRKILGINLTDEEIKSSLERMMYDVDVFDYIKVRIPPFRCDILHPIDIIEDVAIGYGYWNFSEKLPDAMTIGEEYYLSDIKDRSRKIMVGMGFQEVMTLSLTSRDTLKKIGVKGEITEILNPITDQHTVVRASLYPSLLEVLKINKHRELPQKIFEVGDIVMNHKNKLTLCSLITSSRASFTEIKSHVESFMREVGLENFSYDKCDKKIYIMGRCAYIILDDIILGDFGEIHPEILEYWQLTNPVTGLEIDLEAIHECRGKVHKSTE